MTADSHPDRARATAPSARDDELIAEASAPPELSDARESLAFWEKRLANSHVLERSKRQEAKRQVSEWRQRVREAERLRKGPAPLEQLLQAAGIRRLPGRELVTIAKRIAVFTAVVILLVVIATIVFWPEIESVLGGLIQITQGSGGD